MGEFPALPTHSPWVEQTLAGMTLDQRIGQMLHPCLERPDEEGRLAALGGVEPGGMFLFQGKREQFLEITHWLQERSPVPLIVSADLENGAGRMVEGATVFPELLALAAADDEQLAFEMGHAAALEGRACGVHWAFAPVVDMNINPHNPGTNTRGLGDDPDRVARLSRAIIRGMQNHGLCATAKHFPGGGLDDRDPHLCTTINSLRMDQWFALSGRMFQEAIDLGIWSIMIGHTALPAWDPGQGIHLRAAPPASISPRLLGGLLRERMGFQGVIISDAMNMGGVTSWGPVEEILPHAVEAGCDMILFASANRDFAILKRAVQSGRLSEARIEESVRRILALKELLGLHADRSPRPLSPADGAGFQRASRSIAERAVTLVRDCQGALPLRLEQGVRLLSYHLRGDPTEANVDAFDHLLRQRGAEVTRYDETQKGELLDRIDLGRFDVVLIQAVLLPSWGTSRIRPAGAFMRDVWALTTAHHPRLVLISYGSPYLGYEIPHLPTLINAYSPDPNTQGAVLRLLTGEMPATGRSPVDLDAAYRLKSVEGLRYPRL